MEQATTLLISEKIFMPGRRINQLRLECVSCNHEGVVMADVLEEKLGEELTVNNVSAIYNQFSCAECQQSSVRIYDDTDRLLIDPENIAPCYVCHSPIVAPRLEAQPETNVCTVCAEENARPPVDPPYPQPPADQKICPRCGNPTVVRQNSQDLNYFLGCTSFPKCRWAAEL